ncbi:response regulator [Erwinia sorbitola]|uniref:Response regulator n=1 Tax=Erwinia sorbitola TaxID=2681984 RepID=A0A6I6EA92_9GAMM|nr:response regulator [Erwinia sorbitola]MTD28607.1 response regulator [Erwinia sorbitola]QGU86714.1 response regulator [Erwinia sorbitola]
MEEKKVSVLIVDDHPLMRDGIRQLLALDSRFTIVADVSSGSQALEIARQLPPDLILLDLRMKGLSGLETLNALRAESIYSRVVVLTVSDQRSDISALLEAGADGYLLKDSEPEELLAQIIQVAEGGVAYSAPLRALRNAENWKADPFVILTGREQEVLKEVASGLSNRQVAENLAISEQTVKVHLRSVLRKLNVRSRVAATVLWLESHRSSM